MAFIETPRFPLLLVPGASGGPEFSTEIATVRSGFEVRNVNWLYGRRRFNAALGVKTIADCETLLSYFNAMAGRAHGFRYKDWSDYKSGAVAAVPTMTDQNIGTGNGTNLAFQLTKKYTQGALTYTYLVRKPVAGTTLIAVNGVSSAVWTINTTTGVVTFNGGSAPGNGLSVTAGYEYDVPVRFDTDFLDLSLISVSIGEVEVPVIEIRT